MEEVGAGSVRCLATEEEEPIEGHAALEEEGGGQGQLEEEESQAPGEGARGSRGLAIGWHATKNEKRVCRRKERREFEENWWAVDSLEFSRNRGSPVV